MKAAVREPCAATQRISSQETRAGLNGEDKRNTQSPREFCAGDTKTYQTRDKTPFVVAGSPRILVQRPQQREQMGLPLILIQVSPGHRDFSSTTVWLVVYFSRKHLQRSLTAVPQTGPVTGPRPSGSRPQPAEETQEPRTKKWIPQLYVPVKVNDRKKRS